MLHAAAQGGIKIVSDCDPAFPALATAWVAVGSAVPWTLFLLRGQCRGSQVIPGW